MITILQQGQEAKVQVSIKDFDMRYRDFKVSLIYGYRRTVVEIPKSAMVNDDEGNWYFGFDTEGMVGKITALCEWQVPDEDYPDQFQTRTDEQYLCFVVATPCPRFICCPACSGEHDVTYTFTDENNVSVFYLYLCDCDHNPILTKDGENILVLNK